MSDEPRRGPAGGEELALLVDAVQDYALFLLGPTGEIRSWNTGATRTMGYREEEIIGRNFAIFYGPEDLAARKPQTELEIAARDGRVEDQGWRVRKDGTRFWANTVITVLRNPDGTVRGFAKVTRDMTERRRADEELRQSTEIFQLLVSRVAEYAIFMLDPEGHIATWNAGAERIKGYTPQEIVGRHFSEFYTDEDRRDGKPRSMLERARLNGSVEDEGWRVRKDGSRFWANVVITAVHDEHGQLRGFTKVTRDMSERKRAEEAQRAMLEHREARLRAEEERRRAEDSYRVAQEANRAKDEFLMMLSHELRTPMTSILGWARVLPAISPDDPTFAEAIASIASGAQLQARLIDDILDVSRIVSGKLRLMPEAIDASQVILSAVASANASSAAKAIGITTNLAPDLGRIVADATRIQQVVWNLVSNAVKFTPRGGSVTVDARRSNSSIQISVTDTGEGIDPQFLPHVFEPFRQAESPRTRVHGGLGLGLSIVRFIVEAHGGSIVAESEGRGRGARFTVTLPVAATHAAQSPVAHNAAQTRRDQLRGVDVVLVDDDASSRKMLTAVLRSAGASVVSMDSASAALEAVQRQPPSVLVTDIAMPEMDGYALARALRVSGGRGLKIIALSAFPSRSGETADFDVYLTKPVEPVHLVETVARIAVRGTPSGGS